MSRVESTRAVEQVRFVALLVASCQDQKIVSIRMKRLKREFAISQFIGVRCVALVVDIFAGFGAGNSQPVAVHGG
jgi:hypothetical protein